jgi:serine/threonine-protein kinase
MMNRLLAGDPAVDPAGPEGGVLGQEVPASLAGFGAGALVAGYRLEAQVGAGGMAVVYRARDERLGRLVALKVLAPGLAADEEFRRRFIAESRAAGRWRATAAAGRPGSRARRPAPRR